MAHWEKSPCYQGKGWGLGVTKWGFRGCASQAVGTNRGKLGRVGGHEGSVGGGGGG
jgi:hypothetical protein